MQDNTKIHLELLVEKGKEKTYFEVPFEVPKGAEKIEAAYAYQRRNARRDKTGSEYSEEINIVDLGVRDEKGRFRGASGSERQHFQITENEATPGYIRGELGKGEWALVLGAYKIQETGCRVDIHIEVTLKQRVLLKGDLHVHSQNSDGKYSVDDVMRIAHLHQMDFIFLTDHNTYAQNDQLKTSDALVVMPGMEWTHYNGHTNFLGVKRPITRFISNDKQTTVGIMKEARENGAIVVLNHPFCRFCPWKWGFDVPFDAVEIWNGPIKEADYDAIRWWDGLLAQGRRLPAVGGSDSHRDELLRIIGTPTTFVYSESKGESDILKAIRGGNAFVSYTPDGPTIDLSVGGVMMGGCAKGKDKGRVSVGRVAAGDKIRLLAEDGLVEEATVESQSTFAMEFSAIAHRYIRAEVWRELLPGLPMLASISNPVYIEP